MQRDDGRTISWEVGTTELECSEAAFDDAKRTWHDGLAHMQMDEDWQRAQGVQLNATVRTNIEESRRWMELSARQHRQRMADIAAAGRTARAVATTNSEVLDIGHRGHLERSAQRDAGQARTVDAIGGRSVVVDPESDRRYRVEAGDRYYWGDGDPDFDPRRDPQRNQRPGALRGRGPPLRPYARGPGAPPRAPGSMTLEQVKVFALLTQVFALGDRRIKQQFLAPRTPSPHVPAGAAVVLLVAAGRAMRRRPTS